MMGDRKHAPVSEGLKYSPDEWKTGDEPMTEAQASYLQTLCREAGVDAPSEQLTKAEAAKEIERLQQQTGRGARQ